MTCAGARASGALGIGLCAIFMSLSALFLLVFRDAVVTLYTDDAAVKGIAVSLLLMAAVFQVADGVQIGAAGALRGYKDTRVPMVINMFAYWVLAFPLAFLAAITYQAPPNYVWGGFVVGLAVAAVLLTWRFNRLSRVASLTEAAVSPVQSWGCRRRGIRLLRACSHDSAACCDAESARTDR